MKNFINIGLGCLAVLGLILYLGQCAEKGWRKMDEWNWGQKGELELFDEFLKDTATPPNPSAKGSALGDMPARKMTFKEVKQLYDEVLKSDSVGKVYDVDAEETSEFRKKLLKLRKDDFEEWKKNR